MILKSQNVFLSTIMLLLLSFSVQAEDLIVETDNCESMMGKQGVTWEERRVHDIVGAVAVGCNQCNPYTGDTSCNTKLPLLCFLDAELDQPANLETPSRYRQWSGGIVATTDIVCGSRFKHIRDANAFCVQNFGPGWRVAEHHDGWGWSFWAYGNVGEDFDDVRLWVDINDQPSGTCWAH